jgi:hypothetical protein
MTARDDEGRRALKEAGDDKQEVDADETACARITSMVLT